MASLDKFHLVPILERTVKGDHQALNELLATIRPYLHAQLRSRLGVPVGDLDASAVVQNSLLRISQHIGKLRQSNVPGLLAWAGRIVHYALIDALRQKNRDRIETLGSRIYDLAGEPAEPVPCDTAEQRRSLEAALAQLCEREQQVVKWRFFEQLSDAEISRRIGGSVAAIRVLRCRALRSLKRLLDPV